jgi:hypothetical protein
MNAQWITDRLPTAHDADEDGDVQVISHANCLPGDGEFVHYIVVVPGQPWWSRCVAAQPAQPPSPLMPAPTRWVTAMATDDKFIFAACNDGTMWTIGGKFGTGAWVEAVSIPQPSASND